MIRQDGKRREKRAAGHLGKSLRGWMPPFRPINIALVGPRQGGGGRVEAARERERGVFGGGVGVAREPTHCDGAAHRRQPSGPTSSNRYSVTGRGRLSSLRRFFLFSSLPCDLGARANRGGRSGGKLTRRCARSSAVSRVVL